MIQIAYNALLHLMALSQFLLRSGSRAIYGDLIWQFYLLLGLSFTLSLLLAFRKKAYFILIPLRLIIILLIAYPTGEEFWIGALLLMSLTTETALFTPLPWGRVLSVLILVPFLFFRGDRSAFHIPVRGTSFPDLLLLFFFPLLAGQAAFSLKKEKLKKEELQEHNKRLDRAASRLIGTNLDYQNYAKQREARTLAEERRRISREIHDTVGYSLTNVRVMLEAGAMQMENNREQSRQLILKAMEESRRCLEETRQAMGELRSRDREDYRGRTAISRLTGAFHESTGITVSLEYGEAPTQFSEKVDKVLYRTIQEAMTNSFRHGMAENIDIMFWEEKRVLSVLIRDDGCGAPTVKEGVGLAGMRERVEKLGGTVKYGNGPKGFQVRALIPLTGEGEDGK
ncbi:MAG: sensor histidine kinase [Spirochaetales bacterium]|nr:sensor histidine kinase [Spirochaetales bacterium]